MADGLKIVIKISPESESGRGAQSRSGRADMTVRSPDLALPEKLEE